MADDVTLITGASGFLGHAIMKLLAQHGRRAIGLDPVPSVTADVIDDLSDRARLNALLAAKKVTHIIHAGGISGPMVMPDNPIGVIAINVAGSLNLLRAATEAGVKTFIYCSSVSALGNFHENQPVGEDYPLRPTYGASKAMDMVLRGLWGRIPMDLCSLRFTAIYGPGRRTVFTVETIINAALAGKVACIEPMTDCRNRSKQARWIARSGGYSGGGTRFRISRQGGSPGRHSPNNRSGALTDLVAARWRGVHSCSGIRGTKHGLETCGQDRLDHGRFEGDRPRRCRDSGRRRLQRYHRFA